MPARRQKLIREISILQSLNHRYIVKLWEVLETELYIGMIMEYASGGELFGHILARKYLKEPEACKYFTQLIIGVSYLHNHGIVHRDLKLENLLLDKDRNLIITDFGFANRFSVETDDLLSTSCGSPCYAAPELVVNDVIGIHVVVCW
jgi:protein-serine/threonine kinase